MCGRFAQPRSFDELARLFGARAVTDIVGQRFNVAKDLRRAVIFGRNDLIRDAPISRIDLLACRNTLIYFNSETQRTVMARMHMALADHGVLLLGKSELILTNSNGFTPENMPLRIFRKVPGTRLAAAG